MAGFVPSDDTVPCGRIAMRNAHPNTLLTGTTGSHLHHGLYETPDAADAESALDSALRQVDFPMKSVSNDGAGACARANNYRCQVCDDWVPTSIHLCAAHKCKHVETGALVAASTDVVSKLYTTANLLNTGGHYVMLLEAIDKFGTPATVKVIKEPPCKNTMCFTPTTGVVHLSYVNILAQAP